MTLSTISNWIHELENYEIILKLFRSAIFLIIGFISARLISVGITRLHERYKVRKPSLLFNKIIFYSIFSLFVISAIRELGFDLHVLLGATGILTVAIGFASQTSASNFISGLFLVAEKAFKVGDVITVNGITGKVSAIDLFSIKLLQGDNTLVRLPNEMIIKTALINLTRYPQRRFDCIFTVPANTSIESIRKIVNNMLAEQTLCLKAPTPIIEIKEITDTAIRCQLLVWATQYNFTEMKAWVQETLLEKLIENHIPVCVNTLDVTLKKGNTHE